VARVAVIPGSGASFVAGALAAGADVLVTGDVDHHRAVAAMDGGLSVIDAGHAATERPGVGRLADWVATCSSSVVDFTGIDPTPWKEP
jgi:putative NIF3 family GTP cyclohydrolase 1 type 2